MRLAEMVKKKKILRRTSKKTEKIPNKPRVTDPIPKKRNPNPRNREIGRIPEIRQRSTPIPEERGVRIDRSRFLMPNAKNWKRTSGRSANSSANARDSCDPTARLRAKARYRTPCANFSHEIRFSTVSCQNRKKEKTERVGNENPPELPGDFHYKEYESVFTIR